jgi:hypothetical protein
LNRRMRNAEGGEQLVTWLNSLPEVQTVLAAEFGGKPIRKQNLSEYRKGGYRDWLDRQEALAEIQSVVREAGEVEPGATGVLSDRFAAWIMARYAMAAGRLGQAGPDADAGAEWRRLRELCHDVVALRRGDHYARQLGIKEEALLQATKPPQKKQPFSVPGLSELIQSYRQLLEVPEDKPPPAGETSGADGERLKAEG